MRYPDGVRILAADVGGTKSLLALYEGGDPASLREVARERYDSRASPSIMPILERFTEGRGAVDAAALGVAGPVQDGVCRATNLPWVIDAEEIARVEGIPHVALVNDFEANALALERLPEGATLTLQPGAPDPTAPKAVLGAGTGLGVALSVPVVGDDGGGALPRVIATEGGHADFAPRDPFECALMLRLREGLGRVSVERVISGSGLGEIHAQVLLERGEAPSDSIAAQIDAGGDRPAAIAAAAAAGEVAAGEALRRFMSLYGAEAGNVALRSLPFGGLYVAGGIAPKNRAALEQGAFLEAFLDKGRMRDVLLRVPVHVVLDPAVALLGARRAAEALVAAG